MTLTQHLRRQGEHEIIPAALEMYCDQERRKRLGVVVGNPALFESVVKQHVATHKDKYSGTLKEQVREIIKRTIKETGNKTHAAKRLGISRFKLQSYAKMTAIVTIVLLSGIWCHAQRGTMAFVKFNSADILTWTDGTNRFPVFTEVQLQTGTDKTWRTVAMVAGTNTVMIPKDARSTRYRVRHVHQVGGASSTWCYKSTK